MTDHRVMVFAPAPQLTVTVEQPNDHVEIHVHPGGQGVWQARMLVNLGVEVVFCTSLGGELGRVLRPLLEAEGLDLRAVVAESSSGGYVHDRREGTREEIAEAVGQPLSLLSGPTDPSIVHPDLYRRLATDLGAHAGRVVADLSGDYLAAVLAGKPAFVKVAAVLARGGDLETAVRTGAAAGALNVTRHGLGTGRADAIATLVERVNLEPVS